MKRVAREAAVFAFYLALAIAMTWPLARQLSTALSDLGDPILNAWILDWAGHALTHALLDLYDTPIYYPGRYSLAYSENLIGIALAVLPFHLAGLSPITVYNIAMLLGFALSGYGAFVLARLITGSAAASLVAGVVFAFVPYKFDHLSHLQIIWSGWIPLLLAAVLAYWRRPSAKAAACIAAAFVMNGLSNVHFFLFGSLTAVLTIALLSIVDARRGRRFWATLAASFVIGGLVLLPFLLPYRIVSKEYGMRRTEGEARSGSATPSAWLVTTPRSLIYGKVGAPELHRHEMQLFPGVFAILLAVWSAATPVAAVRSQSGDWRRRTPHMLDVGIAFLAIATWLGIITDRIEWTILGRRILSFDSADIPATLLVILLVIRQRHALRAFVARSRFTPEAWTAAAWIIIGVLGSFGMNAFFHAFLHHRIGVFQAVRAPVRWAIIAYIGLAVWAAIGALALMRDRKRLAIPLVALAALDLWPTPRYEHAVPAVAPVYRWLGHERIAPLLELPMAGGQEFAFLLGSAHHRLPQFNGTIAHFGPPLQAKLRTKTDALEYDDELLALLEQNGCKLIVVHVHALGDHSARVRAWLAQHLAGGRLASMRSFDHDIGGDFVFAVTRNLRSFAREPEAPDAAGHVPQQKLARMLAGQTTHSEAIMARVESPQYGELVRGPLRVRGWALSPFTITRVTVLIDNENVRIDVPLTDKRPDVKRDFHWYYFTPVPGFEIVIPERPRGVPRSTNVQIEIEDEGKRVMRTPDVVIDWERAP
ncbi:MAG TPA: hypothetical protein VNA69_20490 [Thermoanaerobaculia bacterium]|nr:hypothetical protein [Thermoanaerobaculia bacterium]